MLNQIFIGMGRYLAGGILLFGVVFTVIIFGMGFYKILKDESNLIADGGRGILITLPIFIFICISQYKSIQKDFESKLSDSKKSMFSIIFMLSLGLASLQLVYAFIINYFNPYLFKTTITILGKGTEIYNPSFVKSVIDSFYSAGMTFGAIFGTLFLVFRIGIFTSGLTFCIALHNYLNGLNFEFKTAALLFLEIRLPEFWGTVFTIGQLAITFIADRLLAKFNGD
jgi:hypothetical protein